MYYNKKEGFGDPKPEKKVKKKYNLKSSYKRKPTGELSLFKEVWNERPHICTNCKIHLGEFSVSYFDHIISKKQKPELRLIKENLRILCTLCHFIRHNGTKEQFQARYR